MQRQHKGTVVRIISAVVIFILASVLKVSFKVSLVMFIVAYIVAGVNVVKKSVLDIIDGEFFDENILMLIATIGALVTGQYIEAISVMIIYEIGEILQDKAVDDSKKAIEELMDVRPKYANLQQGNTIKKVLPQDVNIGDVIVVGAGESIALDGVVVKGESNIDFSSLTGESLPYYTDKKRASKCSF